MQIEKTLDASKLTMKVSGRLDTMTAPELEHAITENQNEVTELILDFSDLEYISSAGLRVLLLATKMMKGKGRLVIRNINETVKEVFEVTGFLDILNIE